MSDDNERLRIEPLRADRLDVLEPLWRDLLDHLVEVGSQVAIRPHYESWSLCKQHFSEWLDEEEHSFLLVARPNGGGEMVGFAMVRGDRGEEVWYTDECFAELQALVVASGRRGRGIGSALMDAVEARLAQLGITDLYIGVDSVNTDALRFYEARGYTLGYHLLYGRPGGGPRMDRVRERSARRRAEGAESRVPADAERGTDAGAAGHPAGAGAAERRTDPDDGRTG
ncbi:MAG: GNAT family N-acetyltransferase [Actinobacteria bacterium]|nr:GNAT family N-acetyltransferase [Actinomycetota bacterium]